MRTGMGLFLIGVGGILAFAVTANTNVFNLHTAGYVFMVIGILGLAIPRRGYSWVGRRLFVRQTRWRGGNRITDEVVYPTYVNRNPADTRVQALGGPEGSAQARDASTDPHIPRQGGGGYSETVEDVYDN
jgi:hypothetical protein